MVHEKYVYELGSSLDLDEALDIIEEQVSPSEGQVMYYEDDHKEVSKKLPFNELKELVYGLANGELAEFGVYVDFLDFKIECLGSNVTISCNTKVDFGDLEVEVLRGSS